MTPELLRLAGEVLYGEAWQKPLAVVLNVRDDTVRHWLNGRQEVPPGVVEDIWLVLHAKRYDLDGIFRQVHALRSMNRRENRDVLPR